jgi:UDP-N-acetylmuramyl pentapeptide phosphotransferase/UDP-N-acetylglucosamine-1-phosphate transferase
MTRPLARRGRVRDVLVPALVAAASARACLTLTSRLPDSVTEPWARTNHAGHPVTLLEGPAWVLGALAGSAAARGGAARAVAIAGPGLLGAVDDLVGDTDSKGLRGHLGALARGEVTTGAVKVAGLALSGLAAASLADRRSGHRSDHRSGRGLVATLLGGAVIAGAANAVNLFDLRPGRALKVTILAAAGLTTAGGGASPAAALGASAGVIGDDLAARSMLGDTGANAAGAIVGLAVVERTGLLGRAVALAGLAALTLASERVSFSVVIDRHRVLRRIDQWGRAAS